MIIHKNKMLSTIGERTVEIYWNWLYSEWMKEKKNAPFEADTIRMWPKNFHSLNVDMHFTGTIGENHANK